MVKKGDKFIDGNSTGQAPIFRLRISEREKYKNDKQWFKEYLDYLIPYDTTIVDEYPTMKKLYDVVNNNIDAFKEDLEAFCNPMGEEGQLPQFSREEIVAYNKIYNKIAVLIGELIKRPDELKIVLKSDKAIHDKNKALREEIQRSIEEKIRLEIEKVQMQLQGAKQTEIEEYVKEMKSQLKPEDLNIKNFLSEWEIFYTKAIELCKYRNDVPTQMQMSLKHAIISDRCFLYVGWEFGEPIIKVMNPLHCGYHKAPDVECVEHGDYFWSKRAITIADAYNKYGSQLSKDEFDRLGVYNYASSHVIDKRHSVIDDIHNKQKAKVFQDTTWQMTRSSQDHHDKTVGQAQGSGTNRKYYNERLIWETHIEFKAYREIIFLSYTDDYGEEVMDVVPSNFEIPEDATRMKTTNRFGNESHVYEWVDEFGTPFKAEKMWIPRRYEATRLGTDVYVNCREVPNQPINLDNPYRDFELSYKGRAFNNLNSDSTSSVQRALPYYFQYLYVKHIQNRELAKYMGAVINIDTDQIPDYLMYDAEGERIPGRDKVAIHSLYLKKLGRNYYSSSQLGEGGILPATRGTPASAQVMSTAAELINLGQLLELIDREIGMAMGISPQREAMFSNNSNVADNKQAITQSAHITEPMFYMHSQVWKSAINEWLKLFRNHARDIFERQPEKKEHYIQYITPQGSKELMKITPDFLTHTDLGIFIDNAAAARQYREIMTNHSFAFSQNAGEGMETISALIKALTSGESPEMIHKMITVESQKQQARMQQMEQMRLEQEERLAKKEIENREDVQAHELEKEFVKGDYKLADTELKQLVNVEQPAPDQDGIRNDLENQKMQLEIANMQREQARKEKETNIKEKQINKPAATK